MYEQAIFSTSPEEGRSDGETKTKDVMESVTNELTQSLSQENIHFIILFNISVYVCMCAYIYIMYSVCMCVCMYISWSGMLLYHPY